MGVVVPLDGQQDQSGDPSHAIAALQGLVGDDMARVNDMILKGMASEVAMIPELAGHLVQSGGKRLRPMLTLAASRLCGYEGDEHIRLAAAVEFMHTATLLHDDVVDESDMRRGERTARLVWGNQASVLVGDFLLGRAFRLMVASGCLKALDILSGAASVIAEGEVMQLAAAQNTATTEDAYLRVITAKTAALFAAACEVGAVLSDKNGTGNSTEAAALESYGRNLGIAFQLVDDALDYGGEAGTLGKNTGDDFREGKITLPVVLAFRRGDDRQRAFWQRTLNEGQQNDSDLEQALDYLKRHHAIEDTLKRARHYGAITCDALGIFPPGAVKTALTDLVAFCIHRAY